MVGSGLVFNRASAKSAPKQTVVNVAFKSTDPTQLTDFVYNTVDPTSADYHQYLTPTAFAAKFGQPDSYVQSLKAYLDNYHVQTTIYPGNLAAKVTGTPANVQKAFNAKYVAAKKGSQITTAYKLPGSLSSQIVAVIGLYATKPKPKTTKKPNAKAKKTTTHKQAAINQAVSTGLSTTDQKPDTALSGNAFSKKYGVAKFANAYQLNDLYSKGL